jgi:hypothetical protein
MALTLQAGYFSTRVRMPVKLCRMCSLRRGEEADSQVDCPLVTSGLSPYPYPQVPISASVLVHPYFSKLSRF